MCWVVSVVPAHPFFTFLALLCAQGDCLCELSCSPLFIGCCFRWTDEKHLQEERFVALFPRLPACWAVAGSSFISLWIQDSPTAIGKTNHSPSPFMPWGVRAFQLAWVLHYPVLASVSPLLTSLQSSLLSVLFDP